MISQEFWTSGDEDSEEDFAPSKNKNGPYKKKSNKVPFTPYPKNKSILFGHAYRKYSRGITNASVLAPIVEIRHRINWYTGVKVSDREDFHSRIENTKGLQENIISGAGRKNAEWTKTGVLNADRCREVAVIELTRSTIGVLYVEQPTDSFTYWVKWFVCLLQTPFSKNYLFLLMLPFV